MADRRRNRIRDETVEYVGAGEVDTVVETSEDVATEVTFEAEVPGSAPTALVHPPETLRSERYLKTLFWLLIAATFFEGYDSAILALVLPDIQHTFGVPEAQLGISRGLIDFGLFFAFFLARLGDRIGRRKLLLWSVFGYTVFTTFTAFSWDLWSFTFFQAAARVFLGAEYAVAITMIVEEFPVRRRASALGRLLMMNAAGALIVAFLLLGGVDSGPLEWRTLYLIGVIPLVVLGWFRRRVQETRRFEEYQAARDAGHDVERVSFWEPWRPEFRRNLMLVGLVHVLRSLPFYASTAWFFYYAQREAGVDRDFLFLIFIVAYGVGIGGYAFCGFMMERVGRRPTAVSYGICGVVFPILLFQSREPAAVGLFLILGVFFGLGQAPVYGAMATELFPTHIRNAAAAWARNVFEIAGFILGPLLVGVLGDHYSGAFGSIGDTVSFIFLLGIPGVWLVWRYLPETRGRELEDISAEVSGLAIDPLTTDGDPPMTEGDGARPGGARTLGRDEIRRRAVGGVAIALLALGLGVYGLDVADDQVRRPEGAAERFLQAVSQEEDDRVERYGNAELGRAFTGFARADEDDDWFDGIEVGRAGSGAGERLVPFRILLQDDAETERFGFLVSREATTGSEPRDWTVVAVEWSEEAVVGPLVPSGDGAEPASAGASAWIAGLVGALVLTVLLEGLLRLTGGPARPRSATATTGHARSAG